ncbi:hypothetical protein [Siminovitchia terrae]|uniref:hypothetical protein n=1 Tax=Siminovitchia terrae TaxID=1914933 RepID=UPI00163CA173|nr:hypothetical protein [Siminovitchia terrae]
MDATDFQRKFIELKLDKIWAQIRQGAFDLIKFHGKETVLCKITHSIMTYSFAY